MISQINHYYFVNIFMAVRQLCQNFFWISELLRRLLSFFINSLKRLKGFRTHVRKIIKPKVAIRVNQLQRNRFDTFGDRDANWLCTKFTTVNICTIFITLVLNVCR